MIHRSLDAGIKTIIVPGVDLVSSQKAVEISKKYPACYAAVGIHPNYALAASSHDIHEIISLSNESKVVAIGEIGLDLYRDYAPLPVQVALLKQQLQISKDFHLPIILHSRSATNELSTLLSGWQRTLYEENNRIACNPGIMHAFEGTLDEAIVFNKMGFNIGLGGALTYPASRVDARILASLPLTSFVFETDSPYLSPLPWRGKRNEPSYLKATVEFVSKINDVDFSELCKISTETAKMIFRLE